PCRHSASARTARQSRHFARHRGSPATPCRVLFQGPATPGRRVQGKLMATVYTLSLLRDLTAGRDTIVVPGGSVREVLQRLEATYLGIQARLCDGETLRPGVAVAVDGQLTPLGLSAPLGPQSEVHFLPAISGGAAG